MKVETSVVTRVTIAGAKALDPITVILEDIGPRRGKIIIECYGQSWSSYWGGMGERTIAQFFCSCDEHYLAKNLKQGIDSDIVDGDSIKDGAFREIIAMRRGRLMRSFRDANRMVRIGRNDITAKEARALWQEVDYAVFGNDGWSNPELMQKVFGDEWWYRLPTKPNHEYLYLCRIINAVQEGLRMMQAESEAVTT